MVVVLDVAAIAQAQDVVHRYVRVIDATDAAGVSERFADDGRCTGGFGAIVGRPALIEFYEAAWAGGDAKRTHFVTNVVVEDADEEHVEASALFLMTTRAGGAVELAWGSYRYSFRRSDGLLTELEIVVDDAAPLLAS